MDSIAVTVVTGFLGAGKTTLLDAWLSTYARGEVAVIVNEVGLAGVDGELLRKRVDALVEITGGCICCTTQAELAAALRQLAERRPKRIFVETSGAASPAGVVRAVFGQEDLQLDGIIAVVDASAQEQVPAQLRDLAAEQVGYADVVVLAHVDAADDEGLARARADVVSSNPVAIMARAARGRLIEYEGLPAMLAARSTAALPVPPSASRHGAIETLVLAHDGALDEERFADWMECEVGQFAARLLRAKGIVAIAGVDSRVVLQGVADRMEVTLSEPWDGAQRTSRLVVIGFGLDRDALRASFERCHA